MRRSALVSRVVLAAGLLLLQPIAGFSGAEEPEVTGPTVSIEGAVTHPGTYELKPGWSVGDLILAAGKMTLLAHTERVELRRKGEEPRRIDLRKVLAAGEPKLELVPGDHLVIPEHKDRVLLIGFIGGGYRPLVPGQTVSDFFRVPENAALLDTTRFDLSKTELDRKGKPTVRINLKKVLKNPRDKQNVQLESGDIIWLVYREPRKALPLNKIIPLLWPQRSL